MIKMILASTEDGGIGLDNKLPFYCPEDLQYFKEQTEGSIVIMGRKTFDSLPFKNGLPNRKQYVLTKKDLGSVWGEVKLPSRPICDDRKVGYYIYEDILYSYLKLMKNKDYTIFVIGGKSLYEQLFHLVEEVHHTTVKGGYECDTFIDTSMWEDDIDWCLEEVKTLSEVAEVKIWRKC
ncbi:dihydrofolate reductase [Vibrio phage vB_VpaM_R16F]|nr:dihydrofolate reductase [Vibrio phage vB_VpaM_R16F]